MNSKEYDKLTPEEKRIKVAELCGWYEKEIRLANSEIVYDAWFHKDKGHHCLTDLLPDYLNDLNACHEFEMAMDAKKHRQYAMCLMTLLDLDLAEDGYDMHEYFAYLSASSEQRCKAFVLTMTYDK